MKAKQAKQAKKKQQKSSKKNHVTGVQAICGNLCHSGSSSSSLGCDQSQNHLRHQMSNNEVRQISLVKPRKFVSLVTDSPGRVLNMLMRLKRPFDGKMNFLQHPLKS